MAIQVILFFNLVNFYLMKMVKKLPFLLLMVAPYFIPVQSKANWLDNLLRDIFGRGKSKNERPMFPPRGATPGSQQAQNPGQPGTNSVPLDGGTVFLMMAGLGLGAKLLYDAKAKKKVAGGL
jgi:hypothetical protein